MLLNPIYIYCLGGDNKLIYIIMKQMTNLYYSVRDSEEYISLKVILRYHT